MPLVNFNWHSLCEGGTPPRFLIIDDGWQDTENEFQKEGEPSAEGSQYVFHNQILLCHEMINKYSLKVLKV